MEGLRTKLRERSLCGYCGVITTRTDNRCTAHSDLPDPYRVPPDPATTLPTMAAQLREDSPPTKGTED